MTINNTDYLTGGQINNHWLKTIVNTDDINVFERPRSGFTVVYKVSAAKIPTYGIKIITDEAHITPKTFTN